jgi:hypothetical protein
MKNSPTLERHTQIKIACMNKLRANPIQEIPAIILSKIIYLPTLLSKNMKINIQRMLIFPVFFFTCVKLGLSDKDKMIGWGFREQGYKEGIGA